MKALKRKVLALLAVSASWLLVGCGAEDALGGLGKGLGDMFKGFKLP